MPTAKKHILIIDDDPVMRRLFGGRLAKRGFEILYAADGNEGREAARRLQPDLILLDYNMPVMDGLVAAESMKNEAETKNIPIILLTNEDISLEAEQFMKQLAIDRYVPKAADFSELYSAITALIGEPA